MGFNSKFKNKVNQSFDKLIVDPSFIKKTSPKPVPSKRRIFVPVFSASLAVAILGGFSVAYIVNNNMEIAKQNASIKEMEDRYVKPYDGKYGVFFSYWEITDKYTPTVKTTNKHNYYLVHVEMGEVTKAGWIEYQSTEQDVINEETFNFRGELKRDNNGEVIYDTRNEPYFKSLVHFENNEIGQVKLSTESLKIAFEGDDDWSDATETIWGKMPFLGQYESSNGEKYIVNKDATITAAGKTIECAITSYSKQRSVIKCTEQVKKDKYQTYDVEIIKNSDDSYTLVKDGVNYSKLITE